MWNEFVGITHVNPAYGFGTENCLAEGAGRIRNELGSRTIKLYMCPNYKQFYRHNLQWEDCLSLVELAGSSYFKQVFAMDFTTYIIGAFPLSISAIEKNHGCYWKDRLDKTRTDIEYHEFYDFTKHLLQTYTGSGKTFILQNWETDWAILDKTDPVLDPKPDSVKNCIDWINARQNAVADARRDCTAQGVNVYNALEVNLVKKALDGGHCVTNDVVPYTHCDLYSYSAYDTSLEGTFFEQAVDYLLNKITPSEALGRNNLYIGEFGIPENEFSEEQIMHCIKTTVEVARKKQLRNVVYWQLYDNEAREGKSDEPGDCRGFWLIKPSGKKAFIYDYFYNLLQG